MKNLSRDEMKNLKGGDGSDEKLCNNDSDCSSGYVCRERATDHICRCVKGVIVVEEEQM